MAEYLEREGLLRELRLWHMHKTDSLPDHFHYTGIKAWLEALPAADVQPVKHGRWIPVGHKLSRICSVCDRDEPYKFADDNANVYDYCPHCGSKMDGEA